MKFFLTKLLFSSTIIKYDLYFVMSMMSDDAVKKLTEEYFNVSPEIVGQTENTDRKHRIYNILGADAFLGGEKLLHGEFYAPSVKLENDATKSEKDYKLDKDTLLADINALNDLNEGAKGEIYDPKKSQEDTPIVYPIHLKALSERKYDPQLEKVREILLKKAEDHVYYIAKDILSDRHEYLSFEDMCILQLCVALDEDDNDKTFLLLDDMKDYVGLLPIDRRRKFLESFLQSCLNKFETNNDVSWYEKGISYMDKLSFDDKKEYVEMLWAKAEYLCMGIQYDNAIVILKELLSESEKCEEDEFIRNLKAEALVGLGALYEVKGNYREAIASLKLCLKYKPDNKNIEEFIKRLSQKIM